MKIKKILIILWIVILVIFVMSNKVNAISSLKLDGSKPKYIGGTYSQKSYTSFVKNREKWQKNVKAMYQKLTKEGVTPAGACAFLGNLTALNVYFGDDIEELKIESDFPKKFSK